MLNFLSKSFGDTEKSHTFASAFENERHLKLTPIESVREGSDKRKSSLKKIYRKQRSSTRSKSVSRKTITFG